MTPSWKSLGAASAVGAITLTGFVPANGGDEATAEDWIELALTEAEQVSVDEAGLAPQDGKPTSASLTEGTDRTEASRTAAAGLVTLPARELPQPAEEITVAMDASADSTAPALLVEARGLRSDGDWSEWREVAAEQAATVDGASVALPVPVEQVQVRMALDSEQAQEAHPLTSVRVRPETEPAEPAAQETDPFRAAETEAAETEADRHEPYSARLFATRIGLVGATTANGHTVRSNDHFAALPSRRGLAPRGAGDYSIRACAPSTQRCVYLPVWDVGPWNITDDHWNAERETWQDLEHGMPQAQAAYLDGYNNGRDGFDREVANPAGIDLADGAFHSGLGLPTNTWVEVDYLWTGDYANRAEVQTQSERDPVVLRDEADLAGDDVGRAAHSAHVDLQCRTNGSQVRGPSGTSETWYRIGPGNYLPGTFVTLVSAAQDPDIEPCPAD